MDVARDSGNARASKAVVMDIGAHQTIAKRLVVVTGKGGVGKSTIAAALGIAAAKRGLRTIVAEVAACSEVVSILGAQLPDRLREPELAPGLHHVSIDSQSAMEDYLRAEVPGRLPAAVLLRSRVFEPFVAATPGMRELLTIGKVWELTQRPRHGASDRPYHLVYERDPTTTTARLATTFGVPGRRVARAHTDVQLLARRDAMAVEQLREALHDPKPICLADRDRDLHDIRGLVDLHSELFGRLRPA